jgi:hypothetical protein
MFCYFSLDARSVLGPGRQIVSVSLSVSDIITLPWQYKKNNEKIKKKKRQRFPFAQKNLLAKFRLFSVQNAAIKKKQKVFLFSPHNPVKISKAVPPSLPWVCNGAAVPST